MKRAAMPSPRSGDEPPVFCARVSAGDRLGALGLLLTGQAVKNAPAAEQFLAYAREQRFELEELWLASIDGRPCIALLIVPSAGRTGMIFLSPLFHRHAVPHAAALVSAAAQEQDSTLINLLQALLEPRQALEAQALADAGFITLGQLTYMRRAADLPFTSLELNHHIQLSHWSPAARPHFERAILSSYQDTLDCPRLVGMRRMEDIIAGHMSTGQFDPRLWFALHREEEPMAVMLLNPTGQGQTMELVYLGVSPAWRGQGLGRKLLIHGLGLANRHGAAELVLAVDQMNKPALRLYRSLGFVAGTRKLAMVFALNPKND